MHHHGRNGEERAAARAQGAVVDHHDHDPIVELAYFNTGMEAEETP